MHPLLIQVTTSARWRRKPGHQKGGCFFIAMSQPIEQAYKVRTSDIPAFAGCNSLVVGSGSEAKRETHAALLEGFSGKVLAKCPEKDFGVKESEGVDAVKIAQEKAEVVHQFLERETDQDEIIVAGDVVVAIWRPGDDPDQVTYLFRPDRKESSEEEAKTRAELLYCNGSFYVAWHVGANIRRPSQGWEHSAGIRIKAEMKELPKELVEERASRPQSLKDNSIVNLVSLVEAYATKVTIRNRWGNATEEIEVDAKDPLLQLLIVGCALPHALLAQAVDSETPLNPDGTKRLKFDDFAIMGRHRD